MARAVPLRWMHHLMTGLRQTLLGIFADRGVLLLLVLAPIIYGFFYPWPYSLQTVQKVPVAVVDLDHSALSRQIVRFAEASPRLDVLRMANEQEAQQALLHGEILGYALIPDDLKRQVVNNRPAVVHVYGNAGYTLLSKSVLTGFAEAVGTLSAGVELRQFAARGVPSATANALRDPVRLQPVALFNPVEGYGDSVVPAVALLILHQTLLMGGGMLIATWAERADGKQQEDDGTGPAQPAHGTAALWAGRTLGLALPNVLLGILYFGWIYSIQGYPRGANPGGALLLMVLFSTCVAAWACVLGLLLRNRERVLQVLLFSSLPLFFFSGYSWPVEALPLPLQWLRWIFPSSSAIQAGVLLNQMGARVGNVAVYLGVLAWGGGLGWIVTCWMGRQPPTTERTGPETPA